MSSYPLRVDQLELLAAFGIAANSIDYVQAMER